CVMKMKFTHVLIAALVAFCCIFAAGCVQSESYQTVGTPLDYSDEENWLFPFENPVESADVFYLYPTVAMISTQENGIAELDDTIKKSAKDVFMEQGTAFAEYCNVYAPYYRQMAGDKVIEINSHDNITEAMRNSESKTDVFAALDYYFTNCNKGAERPFILAGHSQGSCMLSIVLDEYMKAHPEYYKNMAAAYLIGFGVEEEWVDANPHLKFAEGETDTGVIISWNTEAPGATKTSFVVGDNSPLVINPLIWKTDETYADKSLNKGSIVESSGAEEIEDGVYLYGSYNITLQPGLHDAQVNNDRGVLICTTDNASVMPYEISGGTLGDKSLHGEDYAIYYANIAENGKKRIDAFLAEKNA
ncbi:MAG TPA: DUF3089 domain-containing protein, partial [Methanocorpusculum sp.]|nr:DUF3089 domain-containing protein [Methanocorpusculum sp.]